MKKRKNCETLFFVKGKKWFFFVPQKKFIKLWFFLALLLPYLFSFFTHISIHMDSRFLFLHRIVLLMRVLVHNFGSRFLCEYRWCFLICICNIFVFGLTYIKPVHQKNHLVLPSENYGILRKRKNSFFYILLLMFFFGKLFFLEKKILLKYFLIVVLEKIRVWFRKYTNINRGCSRIRV